MRRAAGSTCAIDRSPSAGAHGTGATERAASCPCPSRRGCASRRSRAALGGANSRRGAAPSLGGATSRCGAAALLSASGAWPATTAGARGTRRSVPGPRSLLVGSLANLRRTRTAAAGAIILPATSVVAVHSLPRRLVVDVRGRARPGRAGKGALPRSTAEAHRPRSAVGGAVSRLRAEQAEALEFRIGAGVAPLARCLRRHLFTAAATPGSLAGDVRGLLPRRVVFLFLERVVGVVELIDGRRLLVPKDLRPHLQTGTGGLRLVDQRRRSPTGKRVAIFTNAFPVHYSPPSGFGFEVLDDITPVQDDLLLFDYNVEQRVNDFVSAAIAQANVTRTNHIMWTMGDDFNYQYAESWFWNMDKLIHYVNKDGRVHALYSTPSIYTDAKHASNESWPLKHDDYFPYADSRNAYWTGYFTSRPTFKRYVRMLSGYYLAARQIEFLVGGLFTSSLEDAMGIAQHHDAVSGTAKQHTTDDYSKRLALGASQVEKSLNTALDCLTSSKGTCRSPPVKFSQCQLLNISYCPSTEEQISGGNSLVIVAYNPLGWEHSDYIRVPVNDVHLVVKSSDGSVVDSQLVEVDTVTDNLRKLYVKAYLGINTDKPPKYWLVFQASVPPMGWNTYFVSKPTGTGSNKMGSVSAISSPNNGTVEVGPGPLKMTFSSASGQLTRIFNSISGVDLPIQQSFLWYGSSTGDAMDSQASGAYIFRPDGATPTAVSRSVSLKVIRGPLVDEVHQQFSSWISQVTRLYKDKDHAEVEYTIGPIPVDDGIGKEVITRLTANMVTNSTFYTDSNGRDFLKRVRNYREDWDLQVTQPVAGNYYPVNLGMYVADGKYELSVLVDRSVGASSIQDGQIEIMLHRRILHDDGRGVGEPLDEVVCVDNQCDGLTAKGTYYVNVNKLGHGAHWRRVTGQEVYSPFLLGFAHEDESSWKSYSIAKGSIVDANYSLPHNVAIITLQNIDDGTTLLRLAHLFQAAEDPQNSVMAKVELKKLFGKRTIKQLTETNLSANQKKSEMRKLNWRVVGDTESGPAPIVGGPVDSQALVVELGPMEIRTFSLKF